MEEGTRCGGRIKTELKGVMRGMTSGGSSDGGGDGFEPVAVRWEVLTTDGISRND